MNEKDTPSYQGISFQVPDYPDSQRIDQSLEKIIEKTREVSEHTGQSKEEIYEEIGFDPEVFVDDYSRNFGYFKDLMSPEEASDYVTSKLDGLVDDPKEESKLKKYGAKIKEFLGGKGFAFLAAGALLGATALSGCVGKAVAPSLPEHDGEVDIANNPEEVITVDDEPGDADYSSIQGGIDAADPGDTIKVYGGYYPEHLNLNKQLVLESLEDEKDREPVPVIDAQMKDSGITLNANDCVIDEFEITKAPFTIPDTAIHSGGIKVSSNDNVFKNNNIHMNSVGVYLMKGSENNQIFKNKIAQNSRGILSKGNNNNIYENILLNNVDKRINEGIGIRVEGKDKIHNNNISFGDIGVAVRAKGVEIFENVFQNNSVGLQVWSDDNSIQRNNFKNNKIGIYLKRADHNNINYNNFIQNDLHGTFKAVLYVEPWSFSIPILDYPDGIHNNWEENYWNRGRIFPKPILGAGWAYWDTREDRCYPVFNFDKHPLKEPYQGETGGD